MGGKWEVAVWGQHDAGRYSYLTKYLGPSLLSALRAFWRECRTSEWGCITLHYRPLLGLK